MRFVSKTLMVTAFFGAIAVLHADTETPAVSGQASVGVSVHLTVPEMRAKSVSFKSEVEGHYQAVLQLQNRIRQAKDVIKLNCINDRLIQLKAQMNIVDGNSRQLEDLLAKDDPNADTDRQTTYRQLEEAVAGVAKLHEAANTCVGEPELYKGESVDVTHPPFPDDPVTDNPFDDTVVTGTDVEPPGYASLFF